jgi:hypothetical protein
MGQALGARTAVAGIPDAPSARELERMRSDVRVVMLACDGLYQRDLVRLRRWLLTGTI